MAPFWGSVMGRGDLSDAEWELIGPLLPPERGRWARPADDNRRFLNGMLHVLQADAPGATCTSATASGTRPVSGSGAESSKGAGMRAANPGRSETDRRPATHVRQHHGSRPGLGIGRKRGLLRRLLVDHAAALRARSTPAATRLSLSFASFLNLTAARLWLKPFVNTV